MLKKPMSWALFPRLTVKRCVPFGTAAGRKTTIWLFVALITVI